MLEASVTILEPSLTIGTAGSNARKNSDTVTQALELARTHWQALTWVEGAILGLCWSNSGATLAHLASTCPILGLSLDLFGQLGVILCYSGPS